MSGRKVFRLLNITENEGGVTFDIRVVPRAARTEVVGEIGGVLKVRVSTPPVDGAANDELIKFFARQLGVAKIHVQIVSGQTSRTKKLRINGITAEELRHLVSE